MLEIWCEIVCAECARVGYGQWTRQAQVPRAELKREAEKGGWVFANSEAFCRAECLTKHTDGVNK